MLEMNHLGGAPKVSKLYEKKYFAPQGLLDPSHYF